MHETSRRVRGQPLNIKYSEPGSVESQAADTSVTRCIRLGDPSGNREDNRESQMKEKVELLFKLNLVMENDPMYCISIYIYYIYIYVCVYIYIFFSICCGPYILTSC